MKIQEILEFIANAGKTVVKLTPTQIDDLALGLAVIGINALRTYKEIKGKPVDPALLGQEPLGGPEAPTA